MSVKKPSTPVGLGMSRDYFSKNLIPTRPEIREMTHYSSSSLLHYDGIELLYVTDGQGCFSVNGHSYSCRSGSLILLAFYHITRIVPNDGQYLRLIRCRLTLNTFLYYLANPCCSHTSLGFSGEPDFVQFEGKEQEHIDYLFSELKKELSSTSSFHDSMSIYILLEMMARIDRAL